MNKVETCFESDLSLDDFDYLTEFGIDLIPELQGMDVTIFAPTVIVDKIIARNGKFATAEGDEPKWQYDRKGLYVLTTPISLVRKTIDGEYEYSLMNSSISDNVSFTSLSDNQNKQAIIDQFNILIPFNLNEVQGNERTRAVCDRSDLEREAMDSIQELICSHLDDIVAQATILKTADQLAVKNDAYARIRFAMARLESLEQTSVYDIRPRFMTREKASEADRRQRELRRDNRYRREHGQHKPDVDVIYRKSDDSYYTTDGKFIETGDEAQARAWYGDASPESMERLRRDRDIAERERELNPLNDRGPRGDFRDDRRGGNREDRGGRRGGYSRG